VKIDHKINVLATRNDGKKITLCLQSIIATSTHGTV